MVKPGTGGGETVTGTDLRAQITVSTVRNSRLQDHSLLEFVYPKLIYNRVVIIFFLKKKILAYGNTEGVDFVIG